MEWFEAVEVISAHVVKIETPHSSGTGFLIYNSDRSEICGIATAAHVVQHCHYWEQPIRIHQTTLNKSLLLHREDRAIFLDQDRDTAAIFFYPGALEFPNNIIALTPKDRFLKTGIEVGWLGYPAILPSSQCFFSGRISAEIPNRNTYFVDAVAINGVSGGPVFFPTEPETVGLRILGVISAYVANRATGETLPGLSVVRDVSHFHELASTFQSLSDAIANQTPPESTDDSESRDET